MVSCFIAKYKHHDCFNSNIEKTFSYCLDILDGGGFYEGADAVILVATGSQRMLIISDREESQVGKAYSQAEKEHGNFKSK